MSQRKKKSLEQRSSRIRKAGEIIGVLRLLWRRYKLLHRELKKARQKPVPQSVIYAYNAKKSAINAIYGRNHIRRGLLFHGTGALQYDGDKYGVGITGKLRRPLDTILSSGLSPHTDPWAFTQGSSQSISFSTLWSYAKFYADVHQMPDAPLKWEYGSGLDWFSYCIVDTARQTLKKGLATGSLLQDLRALRRTRKQNVRPDGYNPQQLWAHDIRNDITLQTSLVDVISGLTDIPDNFGAIITVSENDVSLAPMVLGGTYEKRAARPVRPGEFTSLAVPINKVEEYATKVHDLGYSFPVLPIEAVEYHMSHFPLKELTHAQRVV